MADAGPDQQAEVGQPVTLDGSGSSDADDDPLTYAWSLIYQPEGSTAVLNPLDQVQTSLTPDRAGDYVAQLIVNDGTVASKPDTALIEVTATNQPPSITSTPVTAATAGQRYTYDVDATDPDAGDVLIYSLDVSPPGMTIDPASGLIAWTPAQAGGANVTVRVTDPGGLADTQIFTITVSAPANHAPTITSTPVTAATAGQGYVYDVDATDPDAGDVLTYSLPTAPQGMTIDAASGLIQWTPTAAQVGNQAVTVRVTDRGGLFAEQGFTVTVARDNHAPVAVDDAYTMQQGETLVIAGLAPAAPTVAVQNAPEPARVVQAAQSYGRLPLAFEANAGQTDPRVRFLSRGQGYTLFLTSDEAVLALSPPTRRLGKGEAVPNESDEAANPHVLRLKLLGANAEPQATGLDELPGKSNYFLGNDPSGWRTGVPTYAKVSFDQVYPGIDLVYYGNQRQLEYDFVVAPGADPSQIRLAVEGADRVAIDAAGNLVLDTPAGEIRQHKPLVYQEIDGEWRALDGRYVLLSEQTVASVGFEVAEYDRAKPLVIDPVLEYATYLGGSGGDQSYGIAVDAAGNAYVTGLTQSADFPIAGAVQPTYGGGARDIFVTKMSADGSALVYSTFLGGSDADDGNKIALDSHGNAYVTGQTRSSNFPVVNPFQANLGGNYDAYILKLNADGSRLFYSSYLGGNGYDYGAQIAVDAGGASYLTGVTASDNFPTLNSLQTYRGGSFWGDAFVAKVLPDGNALAYSTYLGGGQDEFAYGIAVSPAGVATVAGWTHSANFPTANALQPIHGGNAGGICGTSSCGGDAFVARLTATGDSLIYSTFLGGSGDDAASGVAVDPNGNTYVTGHTNSTNFPVLNAVQPQLAGGFDAFVAKLNPEADGFVYSTYLGGTSTGIQEEGLGITADPAGNAYITGITDSVDFPTADPIQAVYGGGSRDAFAAKLRPAGDMLAFSTYLGGVSPDAGHSLAVDSCGDVYTELETQSPDLTTVNAFQPSYSGGSGGWGDAFVLKMRFDNVTDLAIAKSDAPDPVIAGNALRYTLTVRNLCNKAATGVTLTDTLPPQITLVSATPTQGACAEAAGTVTCNLGGLAGLASAEVTLVATVNAGQTAVLTNQASVSADQDDPDPRNNSATATTHVDAAGGVLANDYDPDGDPITAIQVAGPAHGTVALNPNGAFTYTPAADFSGTDTFTYRANDGALDSNIATVTITVNPVNHPPVITSSPVTAATVGAPYSYDVDATDPDAGDTLTYALDTSPAGMTIGSATGLIAWTPTAAQFGDHAVTVRVTDSGGLFVEQSFTVTVSAAANRAPTITSTPVTAATAGQPYSYDVDATDPDTGDVLTFSLPTAPAGMTINATTGLIQWTPSAAQAGTQSVTVRVTDSGGLFVEQSFAVTVSAPANRPPVAADDGYEMVGRDAWPTQTVLFGVNSETSTDMLYRFDKTTGQATAVGPIRDSSGNQINVNGDVGLAYNPDIDRLYLVDSGYVQDRLMVVDPATGITEFVGTGLGAPHWDPGLAYDPFSKRLYMLAEVVDPSTLHDLYEIDTESGAATYIGRLTNLSGNAGLAFNWNDRRLYAVIGDNPITVLYTIDVATAVPTLVGSTDAQHLTGLAYDPERDVLFASDSLNHRIYLLDYHTGLATLVGSYGLNNVEGLAIQADLPSAEAVLSIAAPGVLANDHDPDGDPITAIQVAGPAHGAVTLNPNGAFVYTPTAGFSGTDTFTYRANDGALDSNIATVTITVNPANHPPVITSSPVTAATAGAPYGYDVDATDPDAGDTLTYALDASPAGMAIDPATGLIAWTPTAAQVGGHSVTVRVQDPGGLADTQSFTVTVAASPNRPPVIESAPATSATVGQPYSYDVEASDPDAGDVLTFSLPTAPTGMTINATSGLIAWTPTAAQIGTQSVTVRVTDSGGLFAEQSFTVTVSAAANRAPAITSTPVTTATVGQLYSYDADATDPDGDPLTYAVTVAPTGMTIDPASGLIQWTPTAAQTGSHPVTLRVEDGRGGFAEQGFTVTVAGGGPNTAPVITSTPPTGATVGQLYTYAVEATDPDGDPLTYSLTTAPTGMTINATTGLIQWTPAADQTGDHPVALTVADGRGGVAPQSYTLRVPAGPGTISVPDVIGATPAAAEATLTGAGLRAGAITTVDNRIELGFTSLPSAQNWVYAAFGNTAPETQVFTLDGGVLRQNTLGLGVSQGLNQYQSPEVHPTLPFVLTFTARVLQQEGDPTDAFGFTFGLAWGTEQIGIGLRTNGIFDTTGAVLSAAIDTTQFHTYRLEGVRDGGYRLFVDGVLLGTAAARPRGSAAYFLFFGDASHTANAQGEIAAFAFVQGQGLVIAQQPAAGVLVAADSPVALTVAQAPPPVAVPDVVGQPQAAAQTTLIAASLLVGAVTTAPSATVPAGNVVSQTPAAGASVPGFTAVALVISTGSGQVTVPNVVGLTQAAATTALQQAGLALGTVTTQSSATVPAGQVMSQTPAAGAQVAPGAAVNLIVSSGAGGPGPDPVPGLAAIVVQPASAVLLTGQTQSFTATGILSDGTSLSLAGRVVWTSTNPAVASIDAAGVATASSAGATTIRATNGAIVGSATLAVEAGVPNPTPPTAAITAPADQATVTGPVAVTGTASDPEFLKYVLDIALVGEENFSLLAEGTAPVSNGALGTLDPTLLINDLYTLRLTVYDRGGNTARTEIQVQVAREQKVGHFTLAFQDLSVPMACMPLTVTRVYDSRETRRGDFGVGWWLDVQTLRLHETGTMGQGWAIDLVNRPGPFGTTIPTYVLYDTAAHKVSLTLPDGHVEEFDLTPSPTESQYNPIGPVSLVYTPRPGTLGSLAPVVTTTYAPSADTGPVELIDSDVEVLDPRAYRYTTPEGNVYLIDKFDGVRQVQCTNGQTLSFTPGGIAHSDGKSAAFTRDAEGRITTLSDPAGNEHRYAYDANGDLVRHTDPEGHETVFKYDYRHRLLEVIDPRGVRAARNDYDADGRLASTTDPLGQAVTFQHDLVARTETVTDRLGHATVYQYDDQGNVLRQTDALGGITTRTYDAFGNELTRIDPLGRVTTLTYDSRRNPLTETNPLGQVTRYTYTALNAVRTVTDPLGRVTTNSYDANGNLTSTTDPAGQTTSYAYDARGLQTSRTDPLGQITRYAYNSAGNLIQETDPLGHISTYSYDANGNRLSETRTVGGETRVTTFEYDDNNRLVRTTHPDGSVTRTEYNAIGKQARTVDALGRSTSYEYDDAGRLTRTVYPDGASETSTYDAEGRRTASTDRAGRTTRYGYDALGRLVSTTFPDGARTGTTYDAAGQVTASTDALGHTTAYQYDAAGRRTRVTDALGHATTFGYDAAGNQTAVTDANSHTLNFSYDANNRRTRTSYPDGTSDQVNYDALGRQVGKTDQAGVVTQYRYDALGRLIGVTDALGQDTDYGYDEQGNQVSQTDANGNTTTFGYDAMGRRTSRTLPLGMTETMTYDLAGNLASKTDFNGRTTTYGYDALNRLTEKRPDPATGEPTVRFTYTASGQRARMEDASGVTTYAYDNRDRLTRKATPQGTLDYAYDAAGDLLSIQSDHAGGAAMSYAYDALKPARERHRRQRRHHL